MHLSEFGAKSFFPREDQSKTYTINSTTLAYSRIFLQKFLSGKNFCSYFVLKTYGQNMKLHFNDTNYLFGRSNYLFARSNDRIVEVNCFLFTFYWTSRIPGISTHFMEKAMAPHSSTLAWKIPWTEEPGRL